MVRLSRILAREAARDRVVAYVDRLGPVQWGVK